MSPIEAVARAICERQRGADDWFTFAHRDHYFQIARVAVEALASNVTPKMALAFWDEYEKPWDGNENPRALAAAIRAALTAPPTRNEPDPSQ
jgi:hypothetical protein